MTMLYLIACITGLPKSDENPSMLVNKVGEKTISESMKEMFLKFTGKRGLDVKNIIDDNVRFSMQVLSYKLL
jgi:hypothetical protein